MAASVVLFLVFLSANSLLADTELLEKKEVAKTMASWNKALGVKCNFCHTSNFKQSYKDLAGKSADEKTLKALVHKEIAKSMLATVIYLNKREGKSYTCNSCHQGKAEIPVK
jgi:hypothetical protein